MKKMIHGRPSAASSLPPLKEACPDFNGFNRREKYVQRIFELLAQVIEQQRKTVALRFYSIRETADFFGVTPGTVQIVYQRLSQEGLLTRIRSSQTMIPARIPRTRFRVRGVVAMPIWMPGFLQFLDWRQWFSIIEEELSLHSFVAEPVFFNGTHAQNPAFPQRVLKFNPDYILWFYPYKTDITPALTFRDAGIPLLTINNARDSFSARTYPMSFEKALTQGLREWHLSGEIDQIVIAQENEEARDHDEFAPVFQNCPLPCRVEAFASKSPSALSVLRKSAMPAYLARLIARPRTGIIFRDDLFYTLMCNCLPDLMMEVFHRHRVIVAHRVMTPGTHPKNYTADGLFYPWRRLARQIANDLDQAKGSIPTAQPICHAEWCPQMPLAEIFQAYPEE